MSFHFATNDPGVNGTGIAIWKAETWNKLENPVKLINLFPEGEMDWDWQAERLSNEFKKIVEEYDVVKMYIEFPQFFLSEVGYAATAKGNIHVLAAMVGAYMRVIWDRNGKVEPILVNEWKGQMKKEAVINRIERKLPSISEITPDAVHSLRIKHHNHYWDAVGIGLYKKGFMNAR